MNDSLGLDQIGDLSGLLDEPKTGPQEISLDLIDEDPDQPRKFFREDGLEELAATIRDRGVKTPISLRPGTAAGRYTINHGARRFRACKLAGKTAIPAFIDTNYDAVDQVIENLQRDNLTPREIAEFINRMIQKGQKKKDIAKSLGKSPAYVTQHVTLLDLPEPIAEVFNSSRCQDVTVVNELVTAYKSNPEEVKDWIADETQDINRSSVKLLRDYLDTKEGQAAQGDDADQEETKSKEKKEPKENDPEKLKKAIVQVQIFGRIAQLILNKRPSALGLSWCKYEDDGEEFEAQLEQVKVVAILEG